MATLLAKLFSNCTEKNKPLDDAIEDATPVFKDLYKKFLAESIKDDFFTQVETDPLKKDAMKALAFYTRCPGAFDLVNEILMSTEDKIVGLLIFFMRLVEGIMKCQDKSLMPVFLAATKEVYSKFNTGAGDTFVWQGFAPCFDSIDECLKRTSDGEKHVYFKIKDSTKCKDISRYGKGIAGVILPGATFKIENDEMKPKYRIITLTLTESSNEVANALHPTKLKAVTGGPSLSVSNAAFQQSKLKISPLENDFKAIKDGGFYEKLTESLKKIKNLSEKPENSGEPVSDEEKEASVRDLMNRCKETIRYLNEQGILKKYNITEEEAMAITIFTFDYGAEDYEKNPQRIINKTLAERNTKNMMSIRGYILHLLSSLRKLPRYTGSKTLYRGIDGKKIEFDTYRVNEHRTWPAFTSTYPDEDSAMDFLSGDSQVLFEIRGDFHGYDIQDFSIFHEEEILLEPDTEFVIKDIKDNKDDGFKRIIVEVKKFDTLPVYKEVEKFREEAEKKKLSMIPPGVAKKDPTPNVKKPEADIIVMETKRKIFENILCPTIASKEDFDSLKPYNTIAFIRDILPKSSFSNWIHFSEYLSRDILDRVAFFKKEITESKKVARIDDEVKKFIKEYTDLINAVKERIKMASRVELRISFAKDKLNTIESAKKYAKYAAQYLLKISKEDRTDYFMYNGAIKFRGFLNNVIWITMYAKDGVRSADVAQWANRKEIRYINSIVAEPFSLGYMSFFVTNSVIEYDVNRMLKTWFMEKYNICPEFVANYESKSRGVRDFFVCCVTEQSKKILESKTINFLAETRYFKEVIKAQVMSPDGDFFALPFDSEFYFTDIHSGENTIDVTLLNTSFYNYFLSVIKPRPCMLLSCNQQQQAMPTQHMNPPQMMPQQQQQYIVQQQQQQQYIQQPQYNQPYQNQTNIQIPPPSNQLYQNQINVQIPPPSNQLYQSQANIQIPPPSNQLCQSQANIQIPPPSNQQQQQQQQQQGTFIQMAPALNQQMQMQMECILNLFVQNLPDDQKGTFMSFPRNQQLEIVYKYFCSGQTQ